MHIYSEGFTPVDLCAICVRRFGSMFHRPRGGLLLSKHAYYKLHNTPLTPLRPSVVNVIGAETCIFTHLVLENISL